jgi:hypothetical protein
VQALPIAAAGLDTSAPGPRLPKSTFKSPTSRIPGARVSSQTATGTQRDAETALTSEGCVGTPLLPGQAKDIKPRGKAFSSFQNRQSTAQRRTQTWIGRVPLSMSDSNRPPFRDQPRGNSRRSKSLSKQQYSRSGAQPPVWYVEFAGGGSSGSPAEVSGNAQGPDQENQAPAMASREALPGLRTFGSAAAAVDIVFQGTEPGPDLVQERPNSVDVAYNVVHGYKEQAGLQWASQQKVIALASDRADAAAEASSTAGQGAWAPDEEVPVSAGGEHLVGEVHVEQINPRPLPDASFTPLTVSAATLPNHCSFWGSSLSTHPLAVARPGAVTQTISRRIAATRSVQVPRAAEDPEVVLAAAKYAATSTVTVRPHERLYRSLPTLPDPSAASQTAATATSRLAERRRAQILQRHAAARSIDVLAPSISDLWKRQDYSEEVGCYCVKRLHNNALVICKAFLVSLQDPTQLDLHNFCLLMDQIPNLCTIAPVIE